MTPNNLSLIHDSTVDFHEAKNKIEVFFTELEKEYPGFQYAFLGLNPDHVWIRHSECPSITDIPALLAHIKAQDEEIENLKKLERWLKEGNRTNYVDTIQATIGGFHIVLQHTHDSIIIGEGISLGKAIGHALHQIRSRHDAGTS